MTLRTSAGGDPAGPVALCSEPTAAPGEHQGLGEPLGADGTVGTFYGRHVGTASVFLSLLGSPQCYVCNVEFPQTVSVMVISALGMTCKMWFR